MGVIISVSLAYSDVSHSAKHLETPTEQLKSLAGSMGYVAPEVLTKKGHGKPVDIWSIGYVPGYATMIPLLKLRSVITYVLLCGYSPFRSDDANVLIKETTAAKIEFHDRYWKNVSAEGETRLCILRSSLTKLQLKTSSNRS